MHGPIGIIISDERSRTYLMRLYSVQEDSGPLGLIVGRSALVLYTGRVRAGIQPLPATAPTWTQGSGHLKYIQ